MDFDCEKFQPVYAMDEVKMKVKITYRNLQTGAVVDTAGKMADGGEDGGRRRGEEAQVEEQCL